MARSGLPLHHFTITQLTITHFHHITISLFHHFTITSLHQVAQKKGKGMKEIATRMDSIKFNAVLVEKAENPWNLIYIATAVIIHKNQEVVLSPLHHYIIASLHHCTITPLHHCTIAPLRHPQTIRNLAMPAKAIQKTSSNDLNPAKIKTFEQVKDKSQLLHHFTISPFFHFTTSPCPQSRWRAS